MRDNALFQKFLDCPENQNDEIWEVLKEAIGQKVKWVEGGAMCLGMALLTVSQRSGMVKDLDVRRCLEYIVSAMDDDGVVRRMVLPVLMKTVCEWYEPEHEAEIFDALNQVRQHFPAWCDHPEPHPTDIFVRDNWDDFVASLPPTPSTE
jgi:hypothetical protein